MATTIYKFDIGEQSRAFVFNINSVDTWCKLNGKKMRDFEAVFSTSRIIDKDYEPSELRDLVFAGLKEGNRCRNGIGNPDFTAEDVGEWMTNLPSKTLSEMYDCIVEYLIPDEALKLYKKKAKPKRKTKKKAEADDLKQSDKSDIG